MCKETREEESVKKKEFIIRRAFYTYIEYRVEAEDQDKALEIAEEPSEPRLTKNKLHTNILNTNMSRMQNWDQAFEIVDASKEEPE